MNPNKKIKILQLIDSLEAGGAERMAVNYANALCSYTGFGALATTRAEGILKQQLNGSVCYNFLNRKQLFVFKALFLLRKIVKENEITHIQAHSSSLFFAVFLKLICPQIILIWHDHYGASEMLKKRPVLLLQIASIFVRNILSVNQNLKAWALDKLYCKKVCYLPNFTSESSMVFNETTRLFGASGKRIVCLANLRPQKNHMMLLQVARILKKDYPDWTFHLVGKDFHDDYSKEIVEKIAQYQLEDHVFVYGSRSDIPSILNQSTIGVLTSISEGLPVAILEYGFHSLAVVATKVGEVPTVLNQQEGILIESNDVLSFCEALKRIITDKALRIDLSVKLHSKVISSYSEKAIITLYTEWIHEK